MLSLKIKLDSFDFFGNIINWKDAIRVNITTLPDKQKQSYTFNVNKINVSAALFTIKFSKETQNILIIFQKLGHFKSDQVIASTSFKDVEILKFFDNNNNIGVKKVDIYESFQSLLKNNFYTKKVQKRKIVGTMMAQFTLIDKFALQYYHISDESIKNNNKCKNINESQLKNNDILVFQGCISN